MNGLFVLELLLTLSFCLGYKQDEIRSLPGLDFDINFKHYSGYLKTSKTQFFHYWFVESQNDPATDPLMFWFNGGPGCSSLEGLLHEMGPYQINEDGKTLRRNPHAWNKFASIVYIESPAGVGYSYSTENIHHYTDDMTSSENYKAMKHFFKKHPFFRNHSTFIFGESYGGVYVPTLASRIIDGQSDFPVNLEGIGIGNGALSPTLSDNTKLKFFYYRGLVDESVWTSVKNKCCGGCTDTCDFASFETECYHLLKGVDFSEMVNEYDIYKDCERNVDSPASKRSNLLQFVQHHRSTREQMDISCLNNTDVYTYLNSPAIRKALNIPENAAEWNICNLDVYYSYKRNTNGMSTQVQKILDAKIRVLLYYGDTDFICNFLMGQQFAEELGLKKLVPKTAWKVGGQVGGFKTEFEGLTFTTIRGAGHMAPQWKPLETAHVARQFLNNEPI